MFKLNVATRNDIQYALHSRPEIAQGAHAQGFVRVAEEPDRYGAKVYCVTRDTGSKHLLVLRVRNCPCFNHSYLGFCYPDRELLKNPAELVEVVRDAAPRLLNLRPGESLNGRVRAYLNSLTETEYALWSRVQRYEQQGWAGGIDPERLSDFTPMERIESGVAVASERGLLETPDGEFPTARRRQDGAVVRFGTVDDCFTVYELQRSLDGLLALNYPHMRAGFDDLLAFDFAVSEQASLRRLVSHGAVIVVEYEGWVVAVGWFYRSFHVPSDRWCVWGRRCIVHPSFSGRGFGRLLWRGATSLLPTESTEVWLRTLVHPRAAGRRSLEKWFRTPTAPARSCYVFAPASERSSRAAIGSVT